MKKTVFLTGAASGIGLATAKVLYEQGYTLGLADIQYSALKELFASWDKQRVQLYEMDITDRENVDSVLTSFTTLHGGKLDVLINNAGVLFIGPFEKLSYDQHKLTFDVNVMGLINLTQMAYPYLKAAESPVVINMSSASSSYGIPEFASYSASKFAVRGFTEALEIEWGRQGIRVVDVVPPFVNTHMVQSQQYGARIMDAMGVNLEAKDVANVIAKQIDKPKLHRPVGWQFSLMNFFSELMPNWTQRLTIKFLSR